MISVEDAIERLRQRNEKSNPVAKFLERQAEVEQQLEAELGTAYGKTARVFEINKAEQAAIDKWYDSLRPEILKLQGKSPLQDGEPYYGAVGGGLTYSFVPTSLGTILLVKETTTGKELNVSDALEWIFYG